MSFYCVLRSGAFVLSFQTLAGPRSTSQPVCRGMSAWRATPQTAFQRGERPGREGGRRKWERPCRVHQKVCSSQPSRLRLLAVPAHGPAARVGERGERERKLFRCGAARPHREGESVRVGSVAMDGMG